MKEVKDLIFGNLNGKDNCLKIVEVFHGTEICRIVFGLLGY